VNSLLLAAILLTSIQRSGDGSLIVLNFDSPVSFIQTAAASPPSVIIDVAGAETAKGLPPDAAKDAGLVMAPASDPPGLRITAPLSRGARARVSSSGSKITIELSVEQVVAATGPSPQDGAADQRPPSSERVSELTDEALIGPEDLLEINVFELPELKTTTRVLGDGTISLPLLGVVQASGLTKTALETRIRDLLEERFVHEPQVTIAVTEHRSRQVSVLGAVSKPGPYQMIGPRTILQMISEAGGLTKEAGTDIFILRKTEAGHTERLGLNLEDLVTKGNPELNLTLTPGDVINVPVDTPIYVFVDGAVKSPGQIEGRFSRPITLLQAVARAGGLTERANLRGVHILRKTGAGSQSQIPVNLRMIRKGKADDIVLEDGDVVVVPETFF
jgi:polysaccharide export outer membrane protein